MKKFHIHQSVIVLVVLLTACQSDKLIDAKQSTVLVADKFVEFEGMTVRLPNEVSEEFFRMTDGKNLVAYAIKEIEKSLPNTRVAAQDYLSGIPWSTIIEILNRESQKYPKLDYSKEKLEDNILEKVKKDIPSIKNHKDAIDNSTFIFDYYNRLLRNDLLKEVKKIKHSGAKTQEAVPPGFYYCAYFYPQTALALNNAKNTVEDNIVNYVGENDDTGFTNAFRHSSWNAIGVANCRKSGDSKLNALRNVRTLTSAYESSGVIPVFLMVANDPSILIVDDLALFHKKGNAPSAMDLNNNMIGRTYLYNNMGYWPWQVPTSGKIMDQMKIRAIYLRDSGAISDLVSIQNSYDINDSNNAWLRLYLWEYYNDMTRTLVKLM
jgi:hypothetical protein